MILYGQSIRRQLQRLAAVFWLSILLTGGVRAAGIDSFFGDYKGSADVEVASGVEKRDMSVSIGGTKKGFTVEWTSTIFKPDGRTKARTYSINFVGTDRENVYASAMKTNVFGHEVPLDPLEGDPYVWSRITGDTLTVFSLYVDGEGGYEMQEYNRSLVDGGLNLNYERIRNGEKLKSVTAFLKRE